MQKNSLQMQINNFRIINSLRRKRISFRFAPDGVLEVLAPPNTSELYIRQSIIRHQQQLERLWDRTPRRKIPDFSEGGQFLLLGAPYPLHLTNRLLIFDNAFMVPADTTENIRQNIIKLYHKLAASIIRERVALWENICGTHPAKLRISSADTRWGSCSSNRTISFSWKLIQCPLTSVDYVIVHELTHLKEMSHSPRFWAMVAQAMPEFKTRMEELKSFGSTLPVWQFKTKPLHHRKLRLEEPSPEFQPVCSSPAPMNATAADHTLPNG